MIKSLELLLLPPNSLIGLAVAGLILLRTRWRRLGVVLLVASQALLYAFCTPLMSAALLRPLDRYPPLDLAAIGSEGRHAIVVLSAGVRLEAREYGRDTAGSMALERLHYGAWLAQRLGHPILLTGSTSAILARTMVEELGIEARWIETESQNTFEHARNCADLLRDAGIERIYLVTHFWHMPRAMAAFGTVDTEVVPAPLGFGDSGPGRFDPRWLVAGRGPFCLNSLAMHEWIGRLWYRLRYGV